MLIILILLILILMRLKERILSRSTTQHGKARTRTLVVQRAKYARLGQ